MVFMAPEMFLHASGVFTEKSDMWSMGIILSWIGSAITLGKLQHPMLPLEDGHEMDIHPRILTCAYREQEKLHEEYVNGMPMAFLGLAEQLLVYEPSERASAASCLGHEWVAKRGRERGDSAPIGIEASHSLDSIQGWKNLSSSEQSMLSLVASNLHDNDVGDLVSIFTRLDTDKSGVLSREQFVEGFLLVDSSLDKQEVEELFAHVDTNGSGTIDYHEWLCATTSHSQLKSPTAMLKTFDTLDTQGRGTIKPGDLAKYLGEEGADRMCRKYSRRASCSLTATDFTKAMRAIVVNRQEEEGGDEQMAHAQSLGDVSYGRHRNSSSEKDTKLPHRSVTQNIF